MRSSEARARNGVADAGRRNSKGLKLRLFKPAPPAAATAASAAAASSGEGSSAAQAAPSALCSSQLWQASGHLQQRLSCDRSLYFPELAIAAPVLKYVPDDSSHDVQHKRPKLGNGQYRQQQQQRQREAGSDSSPPGTPFQFSRAQYGVAAPAADDRALGNMLTCSSSSSDGGGLPRRQSSNDAADDVAWPIVVPHKRRRSSRRRRISWTQLPAMLRELQVWRAADATAASAGPADIAAAAAVAAAFAPSLHPHHASSALQPRLVPHQLQGIAAQQQPAARQQDHQQQEQQQQQQDPQQHTVACVALHAAAHSTLQPLLANPSAGCAAQGAAAAVLGSKAAAIAGDASPGQETSQLSDTTCMEDSPRAAAAAVLTTWPSSSTDSDCQMQQQAGDTHKASLAATAAAAAKRLVGQCGSPGLAAPPSRAVC